MWTILRRRGYLRLFALLIVGLGLLDIVIGFVFNLPPFSVALSSRMQRAVSKAGRYTLVYPETWFFSDTPQGDHGDDTISGYIEYPKLWGPGVHIVIRRSRVPYSNLSEVKNWGEEIARAQPQYRQLSLERNSVDHLESWNRNYSFILLGPLGLSPLERECVDNYRLQDRVGYILTLCADADDFARLEPTFRQMIASFTLSSE